MSVSAREFRQRDGIARRDGRRTGLIDDLEDTPMAKKAASAFDPMNASFLKADVTKMFRGYEALDMKEIAEAYRKNLEALTTANKTAVEGMQAICKRQSEILKDAMDEANAALQDLQTKGFVSPDASAQIDTLKSAIDAMVDNSREILEMMAKSQAEAFDVVNERFAESLDELKAALAKLKA